MRERRTYGSVRGGRATAPYRDVKIFDTPADRTPSNREWTESHFLYSLGSSFPGDFNH
jgi:hypothetical protein